MNLQVSAYWTSIVWNGSVFCAIAGNTATVHTMTASFVGVSTITADHYICTGPGYVPSPTYSIVARGVTPSAVSSNITVSTIINCPVCTPNSYIFLSYTGAFGIPSLTGSALYSIAGAGSFKIFSSSNLPVAYTVVN